MKCSLFSAGGGTEKAEEKTWYKGWGQQPTQPESYAKYENSHPGYNGRNRDFSPLRHSLVQTDAEKRESVSQLSSYNLLFLHNKNIEPECLLFFGNSYQSSPCSTIVIHFLAYSSHFDVFLPL